MKYKKGDKVRLIRDPDWDADVLEAFDKLHGGVATIKGPHGSRFFDYYMEEIEWGWKHTDIKGLVSQGPIKPEVSEPIENRWDILDIRKE